MSRLFQAIATIALVFAFSASAHAAPTATSAPTYCAPNQENSAGLTLSDMTYDDGLTNASDCYGIVAGNDSAASINALGLAWGSNWSFLTKDDNPGGSTDGAGSFMGLFFSLSTDAGTSGEWTLTGVDTNGVLPLNLPVTLDFVGVLKGSNKYSLYWFDDVVFDGSTGGTWTMKIANKRGIAQDLSHLSLYVRYDGIPTISQSPPLPEPATITLLGLGLGALGTIRRRKKSKIQ